MLTARPAAPRLASTALFGLVALAALAGAATADTVFQDGFNDGTIDSTKWPETAGASEDDKCGASSVPYALVFGGTGRRSARTRSMDLAGDEATLAFDLKFGTGNGPCNGSGWDDVVVLAYSTDGGSTWTELATYVPSDPQFAGTWSNATVQLPDDARTRDVLLRWDQGVTSGPMWAIDDVRVDVAGSPGSAAPACPDEDVREGPVQVNASASGEACLDVEPDDRSAGLPSQGIGSPGVPSQSIDTPRVPSQTVETPPVVVPDACTPGEIVCTERAEVLPARKEETPAVPPQHVADTPGIPSHHVADTPAVAFEAGVEGTISADSGHDESSTVGPIDPDPAPIVICKSGCVVPVDPSADADPDARATVTVGGTSRTVGTS